MKPEKAIARIRAIARAGMGEVDWSDHFLAQLLERDIVIRQALAVLEKGSLVHGPRWDDEHQDWVCVLRRNVAGRTIHVVVGLHDNDTAITAITVY